MRFESYWPVSEILWRERESSLVSVWPSFPVKFETHMSHLGRVFFFFYAIGGEIGL